MWPNFLLDETNNANRLYDSQNIDNPKKCV